MTAINDDNDMEDDAEFQSLGTNELMTIFALQT